MMKSKLLKTILVTLSLSFIPCVGFSATKISISQALTDCTAAGNKISGKSIEKVQSSVNKIQAVLKNS